MTVYPEADWLPWLFDVIPKGFWEQKVNQKAFLDWLEKKLGYKSKEDWYQVTSKDFLANHGGGLLMHYFNGSPSALVMAVYSDYEWHPWLFTKTPESFSGEEMKRMLKYLENSLKLRTLDDWYRVTSAQLAERKVFYQIQKEGGLETVLPKYYPEHKWDMSILKDKGKRTS